MAPFRIKNLQNSSNLKIEKEKLLREASIRIIKKNKYHETDEVTNLCKVTQLLVTNTNQCYYHLYGKAAKPFNTANLIQRTPQML